MHMSGQSDIPAALFFCAQRKRHFPINATIKHIRNGAVSSKKYTKPEQKK